MCVVFYILFLLGESWLKGGLVFICAIVSDANATEWKYIKFATIAFVYMKQREQRKLRNLLVKSIFTGKTRRVVSALKVEINAIILTYLKELRTFFAICVIK